MLKLQKRWSGCGPSRGWLRAGDCGRCDRVARPSLDRGSRTPRPRARNGGFASRIRFPPTIVSSSPSRPHRRRSWVRKREFERRMRDSDPAERHRRDIGVGRNGSGIVPDVTLAPQNSQMSGIPSKPLEAISNAICLFGSRGSRSRLNALIAASLRLRASTEHMRRGCTKGVRATSASPFQHGGPS